MKKIIVSIMITLLLFSCSLIPDSPVDMPEGYKILCSADGNKYTLWLPHENRLSVNTWDTKRQASEYAVVWEKTRLIKYIPESDKYVWEDCKKVE